MMPSQKTLKLPGWRQVTFNPLDVKSIVSLEKDSYEGTCCLCREKRILYWHITNFQEEWGDACQSCGMKVQEEMKKEGVE